MSAGSVAGPPSPVLLTSRSAAALLDGRGDLTLPRETRGAIQDWGGVYGQLVRLTGPWFLDLDAPTGRVDLAASRVRASTVPGGWRSHHALPGLELDQLVTVRDAPAGVVRQLRLTATGPTGCRVFVVSRFAPYLLPVLVEGIRPVSFDLSGHMGALNVRKHGFGFRASASTRPVRQCIDRFPIPREGYHGPIEYIEFEHPVELPPAGSTELRWEIVGGLQRDLDHGPPTSQVASWDLEGHLAARAAEEQSWVSRTPVLEFPDAPELEEAYRSAREALRRLYTEPGDGLVGLVAGYPWYSAIWCRDLAVMLPALLWLGDAEWVERSLASVFRFQGHQMVQILGGEPGELPMQVAPGPIFLYGTSDTTLRFPAVVEQVLRHTGSHTYLGTATDALHRIIGWGRARVDASTGLLRHGGEAESIEMATAALSRARYGIDSPDTTIWDSADRRDHAIDVQVLWWSALEATGRLLGEVGDADESLACREAAAFLARTLPDQYLRPDGEYLYDSIRRGRPVDQIRPNALRVVSAGLLDPDTAARVVRRAAASDLTTDWGLRTLSSEDPGYDPQAYHAGQVWPIATAWAADAALAAGECELGLRYLGILASMYRREGGLANECYRGDRPEAFNSCFLLGFSVAPFLTVLFERLWGLRLDALARRVEVHPRFPPGWSRATLRHLRVGPGWLDLDWRPDHLTVGWTGPGELVVEAPHGQSRVAAGHTATLARGEGPRGP